MDSRVAPLRIPSDVAESMILDEAASENVSKASINGTRSETMNNAPSGALGQSQSVSIHSPASGGRRAVSNRSFTGIRPVLNDDIDLEDSDMEKDVERTVRELGFIKVRNQALVSGLAYCLSSCSMILLNKVVLSGFNFGAGISLMFYQNFVCAAIVGILSFFRVISTEPLTWKLIQVWFPVNIIFVGMLITSIYSLKYINVAMVTILKNITNLITALGEIYLFKKHHNSKVWVSLFLMVLTSLCWKFRSLVGSLNKIPLSIAGILLFKVPTSLQNLSSILFGLCAGVFFAKAKMS